MKRTWSTPLLLALFLSSCHVVDRAERCSQLSRIIKKAAPEIAATEITDSPPAKTLRKKARLYGQLAENVKKVQFHQPQVKAEQQGLILNLENLEKHLLEAATAVEAHGVFLERQREATARHEEIVAQKKAHAENLGEGNLGSGGAESAVPTSAPRPAPREKGIPERTSAPNRAGGLPGFLERARQHGPPGKRPPPPPPVRASAQSYSYGRAKQAAESAARAVETSSKNLENACR